MHEVATYHNITFSKIEGVLIPVAFGFVGGCVVLGVEKLGFFLAGAAVGAAISFMLFAAIGDNFGTHGTIIRIVIMIVLALLCGAAVVHQERRLIILISSLGGSYMAMAGADHFVKSGYVDATRSIFIQDDFTLPPDDIKLYVMLGSTVVMAVLGLIVQTMTNKKHETGWEENQYLLRSGRVNY